MLQVYQVIIDGETAFRAGYLVPGMRFSAMLATPTLDLQFQPFYETCGLDHLQVFQHPFPIRILLICDEFKHKVTGHEFATFDAEFESFADGARFDPAGFTKPGGFLAFASVATLIFYEFSGFSRQHDWAGATKHTTITIKNVIHVSSFGKKTDQCTLMTTFPFGCSFSKYRNASGVLSSG